MWGFMPWWGLITCLTLVIWRGNKWFAQLNPRQVDSLGGERYGYHEERSGIGALGRLLLDFDVPAARFFRLRRENWFDRFGKGIRLVAEPEARDPIYDKLFFLDSDDESLVNLLWENKELRALLVSFLGRLERKGARLISMDAGNGKLSLYIGVGSVRRTGQLREESVAWLMPFLQAIRTLPASPTRPARASRIPADVVRRVGLTLFAFGGYSASWIWIMSSERLFEPAALTWFSAIFSVLAYIALAIWAFRHLGRVSNRHRALAMWLFLSAIGIPLCSFALIRAININLDFAEHNTFAVEDAVLATHHKRKGGPIHRVSFRILDGTHHQSDSLRIDWLDYRRLRSAWKDKDTGPVIVHVHPGLLGFGWREIIPQPAPVED
ncbi:hypothetical protein [Dokdonella sp.]|uniref:hypothetical protein n=1 Tax=Dokdonella sp. TaxID=2291710 RepID=UPI003C488211